MEMEKRLLDLEERFWKGDATFYEQCLWEEAIMVFPAPVGMMTRERIIAAIAKGPRWTTVGFDGVHFSRPSRQTAILSYWAEARRESDGSKYTTFAGSLYVNEDDEWRLAFHQQTPTNR